MDKSKNPQTKPQANIPQTQNLNPLKKPTLILEKTDKTRTFVKKQHVRLKQRLRDSGE